MTQEQVPKPDDPDKQIEKLKKQAELLDAQKKLAEAQKALAETQKPAGPNADAVAAARAAKELADVQKALADAQKAKSDADLAAFKASLGEVPSSGIAGTVDVQGTAGELEATLLGMKAVEEAAAVIAKRVRNAVDTDARITVVNASELPTFNNLIAYNTEVAVLRQLLDMTIAAARPAEAAPAPEGAPTAEAVPMLAAAGIALDATSKLLSFFRSDVALKGVALTLDDSVAMNAVAGALSGVTSKEPADRAKQLDVRLPTVYQPTPLSGGASFFVEDVADLSKTRGEAQALLKEQAQRAADLTKALELEADPTAKAALQEQLTAAGKIASGLQSAIALMDAWYAKLGALDAKGVGALVGVARERAIVEHLEDGYLLVVKLQKAGGGVMTKKNLWTFLGGIPLFHMGGAALSFTLIDGALGKVRAAGVVPIHGGFVKAGDLRTSLA